LPGAKAARQQAGSSQFYRQSQHLPGGFSPFSDENFTPLLIPTFAGRL